MAEPKAGGIEPKTESNGQDKPNQPKRSEAQFRAVHNLSRRRGISVEELKQMVMETYNCELENLNSKTLPPLDYKYNPLKRRKPLIFKIKSDRHLLSHELG